MTIRELIIKFQEAGLNPETQILVSSDEEWNNLFSDVQIGIEEESGKAVIFGLTGSEQNIPSPLYTRI